MSHRVFGRELKCSIEKDLQPVVIRCRIAVLVHNVDAVLERVSPRPDLRQGRSGYRLQDSQRYRAPAARKSRTTVESPASRPNSNRVLPAHPALTFAPLSINRRTMATLLARTGLAMVPLGLIDVGSSFQEEFDHHAVGRLDQGRATGELVPRIDADVCAVCQQQAYERGIARSRGHGQERLSSAAAGRVRISAGLEQEAHHPQVALLNWIVEKGHAPRGGKRNAVVAEGVEHCGVAGFDLRPGG